MIKIIIPPSFALERTYAIDVLMNEILCLEYQIEIKNQLFYQFELPNGKLLILKDHFFSLIEDGRTYLEETNIPDFVSYSKNRFLLGDDIPVFFGSGKIREEKKTNKIIFDTDIFAIIFFMLSRWEEYVNPIRDIHDRFPATASLAYQFDFLDRPIVNEYAEMVWQILQYLGCKQKRSLKPFRFILTHDVDALLKWIDWKKVFRSFTGDIIKRNKFKSAFDKLFEYRSIKSNKIKDPFDNYDKIMDISESFQLKSYFNFMCTEFSESPYDFITPYSILHKETKKIINKIRDRGHHIGFHPGYDTYNNEKEWKIQRDSLENNLNMEINNGRQHYLRFQVPYTWQIWENQGMLVDSTCGFADREGFRCGTGNTFPVFNILTRKKLKLREQPLIFMDSRNFYCGGNQEKSIFQHHMGKIIPNAKKYKTPITLLFHPNYLSNCDYSDMYMDILYK